jgi:hypothetical protein
LEGKDGLNGSRLNGLRVKEKDPFGNALVQSVHHFGRRNL